MRSRRGFLSALLVAPFAGLMPSRPISRVKFMTSFTYVDSLGVWRCGNRALFIDSMSRQVAETFRPGGFVPIRGHTVPAIPVELL
jgi:hypothetical protein